MAFKSKSQPGRREKPKKSSKPQKTNEAKIKGTNKDLRYEPRIQVRTRGGAEIKGTMDGSGIYIYIYKGWKVPHKHHGTRGLNEKTVPA